MILLIYTTKQYIISITVNIQLNLPTLASIVCDDTTMITGPPSITIHPSSQLVTSNMNITINCEGTGKGSITYQWETSNIIGLQWIFIGSNNSKTLVVGTLEQSQQYRCVVSNEVGSTRSNVATVTVLSE